MKKELMLSIIQKKMGNALLVCGDVYLWILLMETNFR